MTVSLYNCTSASNVLNKSMSAVGTAITATAKGVVDVDNPTLLLNYSSMDFNYFYISEFGRYYNVTSRQLSPAGKILVTGLSDPLESFKAAIGALEVLVVRCEDQTVRSADIADSAVPMEADMQLDKIIGDTVIGAGSGMIVLGVV